ncbi:hypothetical protein KIN20_026014 [Parelaphostrongylus tenuis]|uniref:Uncharacterized protein n=1 Tax=Parelaphostrongylus tenuis TaxID=148309 RepID=A0AAD5N029_PARTN|nr:hypothetical protein KIN20_026014 [Parelaphostrongylus tenuis]
MNCLRHFSHPSNKERRHSGQHERDTTPLSNERSTRHERFATSLSLSNNERHDKGRHDDLRHRPTRATKSNATWTICDIALTRATTGDATRTVRHRSHPSNKERTSPLRTAGEHERLATPPLPEQKRVLNSGRQELIMMAPQPIWAASVGATNVNMRKQHHQKKADDR